MKELLPGLKAERHERFLKGRIQANDQRRVQVVRRGSEVIEGVVYVFHRLDEASPVPFVN